MACLWKRWKRKVGEIGKGLGGGVEVYLPERINDNLYHCFLLDPRKNGPNCLLLPPSGLSKGSSKADSDMDDTTDAASTLAALVPPHVTHAVKSTPD